VKLHAEGRAGDVYGIPATSATGPLPIGVPTSIPVFPRLRPDATLAWALAMPKKKVLIIDDHAGIRFLLRSLVETDDFTVCGEASNGTQGIEKAKETDPDLVLLDFSMPGINGAETAVILKRLKRTFP
jgi:PleD family two-component response regulator